MTMIIVPAPPVSPGKGKLAIESDGDTTSVSSGESPASVMEKQLSSNSISAERDQEKDPAAASSSSPATRRSIFSTYWQRNSSSISFKDDDNKNGGNDGLLGQDVAKRSSQKLDPSYMGVYSFAPSPVMGPKPAPTLSPISSLDSLNSPALRPKSILRRRRSFLQPRVSPVECRPNIIGTVGRPRSVSCSVPESSIKAHFGIAIAPPPFNDDMSTSEGSELSKTSSYGRGPSVKRQHSFVHFDPTITVRECVGEDTFDPDQESNWFSEHELKSFMVETVNLCHNSAISAVRAYSLPHVKKAYMAAQDAGVKCPVLSTTHPEYRALYADPVLHVTDEEAVVHDGSKMFFKIMAKEMRSVLIVDNCQSTLKLFRRHILCMFPHVQVDTAMSGEDALDKIEVDTKRVGLNYDLVVVQERLQQCLSEETNKKELLDLTGSELLQLMNEMEASATSNSNGTTQEQAMKPSKKSSRRSLKIGVSVSLGEDCESLRNKGGVDLFWSMPPPKPSNGLRNQIMNALLSKRGKSIFICGC